MNIPSADYYANEELWGDYQYITMEDVINNYMMARDADDFTSLTPRFKVLYQARRGLRELYYDVLREIRAIELDLSPTLNVILPPDFVNYVRISWVDDQGQLHPMAVDNNMPIAQEYLQDNEYNLLFDGDGCVLQGSDGLAPLPDPNNPSIASEGYNSNCSTYTICNNFQPNRDMSNHFPNGRYRIDKSNGIIQFGSDAVDKSIVLEYISDGLYTGCEGQPEAQIRVHKFAESALLDFIYYQLVKNRRTVPANEKMRARKEFYNSRRIAKRRINTIRKSEVLQAFKGQSKWIKG